MGAKASCRRETQPTAMQVVKVLTILALVAAATIAQHEVPEAEFEMIPAWGDSEDINLLEKPADSNKRILNNIRNLLLSLKAPRKKRMV